MSSKVYYVPVPTRGALSVYDAGKNKKQTFKII